MAGLLQLQSKGDVDLATKHIEEAIRMDNKCEFAYETLGTIEVQRGNLRRAIELFDQAIPLSKTEAEVSHLFSLKDAALAQLKVAVKLGVTLPSAMNWKQTRRQKKKLPFDYFLKFPVDLSLSQLIMESTLKTQI